jgi:hypothetical protein
MGGGRFICGIIIVETGSVEDAMRRAGLMTGCPKLVASGIKGRTLYSVHLVPEEERWWLNYNELFPEEKAEVHIIEDVAYPRSLRADINSEKPPCGADCAGCRFREKYNCRGCPAVDKTSVT